MAEIEESRINALEGTTFMMMLLEKYIIYDDDDDDDVEIWFFSSVDETTTLWVLCSITYRFRNEWRGDLGWGAILCSVVDKCDSLA
jgi:hypothetical protein